MFLLNIVFNDLDKLKRSKEHISTVIKDKETNHADNLLKEHIADDTTDFIRKPGDLNNDGKIDKEDLKILKDHLDGKNRLSEEEKQYYDLNKDGVVDEKDYKILFAFIGRHDLEDRVRELQALYLSLVRHENPSSVVLGVDNANIESVEAELNSAKRMLAIVNGLV